MAFCHHTNLVNVSQTLLHWVDSPRAFPKSVPTRIMLLLYSWFLIMSDTDGDHARDRWSMEGLGRLASGPGSERAFSPDV